MNGFNDQFWGGVCRTPGMKIRSGGMGRGLARGGGYGPMGIPVGYVGAGAGYGRGVGYGRGMGRGRGFGRRVGFMGWL